MIKQVKQYKGVLQDYQTTGLIVIVTIPVQDIIPILPCKVVVVYQPLDIPGLTENRVLKLQHLILLTTHIYKTLDTNSKDQISDELRTTLLLDRDMDGMKTWDNPEYKRLVDHAPQ